MTNRYVLGGIVALAVAVGASACSQVDAPGGASTLRAVTDGPDVPYKLGTFERAARRSWGSCSATRRPSTSPRRTPRSRAATPRRQSWRRRPT